jgi:hypothetical protein
LHCLPLPLVLLLQCWHLLPFGWLPVLLQAPAARPAQVLLLPVLLLLLQLAGAIL